MLAYLGLGSNLGDKAATFSRALALLESHDSIQVVATSSNHVTPPAFLEDQPDFLNACAGVRTSLSASELLEVMLGVEQKLGRVRGVPNGPRTLDLDLLLYGEDVISAEGLDVPHPGVHQRDFVLVGLVEIAPDLVHPVLGKTIAELWAAFAH